VLSLHHCVVDGSHSQLALLISAPISLPFNGFSMAMCARPCVPVTLAGGVLADVYGKSRWDWEGRVIGDMVGGTLAATVRAAMAVTTQARDVGS
jgi:hypothetical protein